jgi:DNA polymerase-3 subunit gamma/tau
MSFNDILSKGFDSHHFVSGLALILGSIGQNSFNIIFIGSWGTTKMYGQQQKCSQDFC